MGFRKTLQEFKAAFPDERVLGDTEQGPVAERIRVPPLGASSRLSGALDEISPAQVRVERLSEQAVPERGEMAGRVAVVPGLSLAFRKREPRIEERDSLLFRAVDDGLCVGRELHPILR